MLRRTAWLLVLGCLSGPIVAAAQETAVPDDQAQAEAFERFDRGVQYFTNGNNGAALGEFLRAYEITGEWMVLYNLGQVSQALGRASDAAHYFERYLAEGAAEIDADRRAEVEASLATLRSELARLRVEVDVADAEILVDDEVIGSSPMADPFYLDPGPHTVLVRHPDHGSVRREVTLASDLEEVVTLALVTPETVPVGPEAPFEPPAEDSIAKEWWFWTIIGAVVAGGAVTAGVLLAEPSTTYTEGDLPAYLLP
jgi:hypothetical protein